MSSLFKHCLTTSLSTLLVFIIALPHMLIYMTSGGPSYFEGMLRDTQTTKSLSSSGGDSLMVNVIKAEKPKCIFGLSNRLNHLLKL